MALSVENIVNMALDEIRYPRHIGYIYEGSPAARVALEIYGQTRDEVLQQGEWPFARREVAATATGQTPPTPWANEYQYPTDCLRLLYVRPGPLTGGTRSFDPQPVLFQIFNDQRPGTPVEAILSDQGGAILIYMGRVTDPSTWQPNFIRAFVAALAKKMSFMLGTDVQLSQLKMMASQQAEAEGMSVDDMTIAPPRTRDTGVVANSGNQR